MTALPSKHYSGHYNVAKENFVEFTPIVCLWSITDTDSVLCTSEDCVILQSIWNTSIAPTWQFRLQDCCANTNSLTYLPEQTR